MSNLITKILDTLLRHEDKVPVAFCVIGCSSIGIVLIHAQTATGAVL